MLNNMLDHNRATAAMNTPVLPPAPPPSLAITYPRANLIAIARASPSLTYPPLLEHLASLPELIRQDTSTDLSQLEDDAQTISATLLADDPPSLPLIDNFRIVSSSPSLDAKDPESFFKIDFASLDPKPPVLINFADPFQSTKKASDAFQSSFPPLIRKNSTTTPPSGATSIRFGDSFSVPQDSRSRSSSISSSFSSSPILRKSSLCPWAAPFPLSETTPRLTPKSKPSEAGSTVIPSLPMPLPKALQHGLPARPGSLPPVFVKKEAAILPQSMALPSVKPMGEWSEEENISGNELRRRRASEIGSSLPIGRPAQSLSITASRPIPNLMGAEAVYGSQSMVEKRPERLVKLGQSLRQSIAAKGQKA